MRGKSVVIQAVVVLLPLVFVFSFAELASARAAFPFSDDFESGGLNPDWSIVPDPNGRIQVTSQYDPHGGSYLVAMDSLNSGSYALNLLDLSIDLAGQAEVELTYWYKEYGDENHAEDGCYISEDGIVFYQVISHNDGPSSWQKYSVNIGEAAAANGISLSSTFVIRFSQYDNSSLKSDGICLDDVRVDLPEIHTLSSDVKTLSASVGGAAVFHLNAGVAYAGREYVLLGSAFGTSPGITLPGGANLPLNPGFFFNCVSSRINTVNFVRFNGYFDASGEADARMDSLGPVHPCAAGKRLDFAYTTVLPFDFQSEPVGIDITL